MNFIKCKEKGRKTMPNIKKLSAIFMSIVLLYSFLLNGIVICSAIDFTIADCFTYVYNDSTKVYDASFDTINYQNVLTALETTEIIMPETYDDGQNGSHDVVLFDFNTSSLKDSVVTKIEFNSNSPSLLSTRTFRYFDKLEEVVFKYANSDFKLGQVFYSCQDTLKRVDIYATGISSSFNASAFRTFIEHSNSKIHVVKDSGVKQQIIDATKSGSAPVPESMIVEDLIDSRKASSIEINCADINYGTKGGFKPSVTVKLDNVENASLKEKVKLEIHGNAECTDSPSYKYNSDDLNLGHYWLKATLEGTDEYKGATAVKEVQVVDPNAAMKLGLDALIKQADEIKSHQGDYYNSAAFLFTEKVIDTDGDQVNDMSLYDYAKKVYNDPAAKNTDIVDAMTKLSDALNSDDLILNSDLASMEERSSFATDVYSKYINENKANYTEDSWKESGFGELQDKLNTKYTSSYVLTGPVTSEELSNFKASIEEAFSKLVPRTNFDTEFAELEKALTNAKAILDDNPGAKYADSQIEALQTAYDTAKAILDDKDNVTDRIKIVNATGNLNNAINSLVEVDRTELLSKLQDSIKEAEAMDSEKENYTAESYKVLTDAIEAAKGITENSTVTEIQTATENIRSAISGLKKDLDAIQAAKDELSKAVEEAEAIDSSKYTEESYANVADAINEAKRLIARQNANLTVSGLKAAQAALEEAINGLKEKQPEGPGNQPSGNNNNNNNGSNNIKKPPVNNNVVVKTTSKEDAVKAAKAKAKSQMKQAKIKKLKVKSTAKKTIKVTWKKVKKAKGYRVQVSTNRKFKKSKIIFEKHTKKKTLKITKKIKSGKTYYVRVSAYTTYKDINGKTQKVYSKNKPFKKVKVK